jgi:hypothetical protein
MDLLQLVLQPPLLPFTMNCDSHLPTVPFWFVLRGHLPVFLYTCMCIQKQL